MAGPKVLVHFNIVTLSRRSLGFLAALLLGSPARALLCPFSPENTVRRIVSCKEGVTTADCRRIAAESGCSVVRELELINAIVITLPADRVAEEEARLAALGQVRRVDPDPRVNWLKAELPFGTLAAPLPRFKPIVPPRDSDPERPWGVGRVNAQEAWPRTQGKGVRVAVIDTGIDDSHPDLKANVAGGWNALDPKEPSRWQDDQGHGTHVAGTIAAARDGNGVVGVAPKARLFAVKVLDAEGNGNYSDIIAGIDWCAKNRIAVANLSLGADEGSDPLREAVKAAAKAGVTIVAAAGNSSGGPVSFPGAYPETIAVSASDQNDRLAGFSSVGPEVGFIAPGMTIRSTMKGGGWGDMSGTSMASPHVAGLAALAVSLGARGVDGVRQALAAASSPLPGLSAKQQGAGLVDAGRLAPRSPGL